MTIVTDGNDVNQVTRQLFRLIEVLKVVDVTESALIEREIALVKVEAPRSARAELVACCAVFGARTADIGPSTMIVEVTGEPGEVDRFLDVVRPFGIKEMMRTGRIAMIRGSLAHEAAAELEAAGDPAQPLARAG
jgi:acetolactate synthase-1/3 small subunit